MFFSQTRSSVDQWYGRSTTIILTMFKNTANTATTYPCSAWLRLEFSYRIVYRHFEFSGDLRESGEDLLTTNDQSHLTIHFIYHPRHFY